MVEEKLRYAIRFLSRHSKDFSLKEWRQINNPNYTKLLTLPQTKDLDSNATRAPDPDRKEVPLDNVVVSGAESFEVVYKMDTAFNLSTNSYYDSFNLPDLTRKVYTYLDYYKAEYDDDKTEHPNSVDMFMRTRRSLWVN